MLYVAVFPPLYCSWVLPTFNTVLMLIFCIKLEHNHLWNTEQFSQGCYSSLTPIVFVCVCSVRVFIFYGYCPTQVKMTTMTIPRQRKGRTENSWWQDECPKPHQLLIVTSSVPSTTFLMSSFGNIWHTANPIRVNKAKCMSAAQSYVF